MVKYSICSYCLCDLIGLKQEFSNFGPNYPLSWYRTMPLVPQKNTFFFNTHISIATVPNWILHSQTSNYKFSTTSWICPNYSLGDNYPQFKNLWALATIKKKKLKLSHVKYAHSGLYFFLFYSFPKYLVEVHFQNALDGQTCCHSNWPRQESSNLTYGNWLYPKDQFTLLRAYIALKIM